jgi:hypothetical protein
MARLPRNEVEAGVYHVYARGNRRARYIARNPVEAGLSEDPRGWRWSSFAIEAPWLDTERLLAYLHAAAGPSSLRDVIGDSPPYEGLSPT